MRMLIGLGVLVVSLFVLLAPAASDVVQMHFVAQFGSALDPEQTRRHEFLVDPADRLEIRLVITRPGAGFLRRDDPFDYCRILLIDPSGRPLDPHAPAAESAPTLLPSLYNKASKSPPERIIRASQPTPGRWALELTVRPGTGPVHYYTRVSLVNAVTQLKVELLPRTVQPGTSVPVTVTITRQTHPLQGATVTARDTAQQPLIEQQQVVFHDDGSEGDTVAQDGRYTGAVQSSAPGEHQYELSATDGETFERLGSFGITVAAPQSGRFTGQVQEWSVDANQDGYFEALELIVPVEVSEPVRRYQVKTHLVPPSGEPITFRMAREPESQPLANVQSLDGPPPQIAYMPDMPYEESREERREDITAEVPRAIGIHEIRLVFPAEGFRRFRENGPYILYAWLEDAEISLHAAVARLEPAYETRSYLWEHFEAEPDGSVPARH